jgi:hypothetical protein
MQTQTLVPEAVHKELVNKAFYYRDTFTPPTDKLDRLAAQHIFSELTYLEELAILAALRGDGIENQLEDEIFHHLLFAEVARMCGGLLPIQKPTRDIIEYIKSLEGAESIVALNVIGECWIGTLFKHLSKIDLAPELFACVGEDEMRHNREAKGLPIPDPEKIREIVHNLEYLLEEIYTNGKFILPILYIFGEGPGGHVGLDIADQHAKACEHLGIEANTDKLKSMTKANLRILKNQSEEIDKNNWQENKMQYFNTIAPQYCFVNVPVGVTNHAKFQLKLTKAVGNILYKYPEFRRVCRGHKLYQAKGSYVGVRMLDQDDNVLTVVVDPTKYKNLIHLARGLKARKNRLMARAYPKIPELDDVKYLVPPSRVAAVVTSNGKFGGSFGVGPLIELEGIPISVTVGEFEIRPVWDGEKFIPVNQTTICVQMDHRVNDGKHIGMFASLLKEELVKFSK